MQKTQKMQINPIKCKKKKIQKIQIDSMKKKIIERHEVLEASLQKKERKIFDYINYRQVKAKMIKTI